MRKLLLTFTLLTMTQNVNAAATTDEALLAIKANLAAYFKDTTNRCFVIGDVQTENTELLNKTARKVIAFYEKAVAANFDVKTASILEPTKEALEALEKEGRLLELEVTGKIAHYWFPVKSVYEGVEFEEKAETDSVLNCTQEIKRAMALVAPPTVSFNEDGSAPAESLFTININGTEEERPRINATNYAAIALEWWFGEAGIEEILAVGASRAENVNGYFKDAWQTGVVRALRHKKANSSFGLSWYEGNVGRASADYEHALRYTAENGSNPFIVNGQDFPSSNYLKRSEELLLAAKNYLAAARTE